MDFPLTLLDLAGAVALLLWGVRMVQTGVQRAFGPRLGVLLAAALRNRGRAFLAGLGATALLQSSTATGLMVSGLAAGGMLELVPALAAMLGANVGSTLIVQLLSFDLSSLSPALVLIGVMMFRRGQESRTRDLGRMAIGLGLMLLALHQLLELVTPYADQPSLRLLLGAVATQPLLDVILAAGLTWAAHSSVAVVLLVMSLAARGVVPPEAAFALVLGANLGTAINPCLEGGAGDDPAARRVPLGNLLTRAAGCAVALAVLPLLGRWMVVLEPDDARAVADFHTAFNLVVAVAFLPVLPAYAAVLTRLLPARVEAADPSRPLYLDAAAREAPVMAVGAAVREALRLADVLESMLLGLRDAFDGADRRRPGEIRRMADVLDRLNTAIKTYLTSLDPEATTLADRQRIDQILRFAINVEQAGDVIARNLASQASRRHKRALVFPPEAQAGLLAMIDRLAADARWAASVFMTEDPRAARLLAAEKQAFRDLENAATRAHLADLRERVGAAEAGGLYLDVIRDLRRVCAHLVAAAATPVLHEQDELLPSRARPDE